jgi:hypothetical protein
VNADTPGQSTEFKAQLHSICKAITSGVNQHHIPGVPSAGRAESEGWAAAAMLGFPMTRGPAVPTQQQGDERTGLGTCYASERVDMTHAFLM